MSFRLFVALCVLIISVADGKVIAQDSANPVAAVPGLAGPAQTDAGLRSARVLWAFSMCLVRQQTENVDEFLATAPHSESSIRVMAPLVRSSSCLQRAGNSRIGEMRMYQRAFRGSLGEARYRSLYPDGPPSFIASLTGPRMSPEQFNARVEAAAIPVDEIIRIFGECVVATRPLEADALVRTELGSAAEGAALVAISEAMGPCMWQGQTVAFNRENLRAALGDALYRIAIGSAILEIPQ